MTFSELKELLDDKYEQYNIPAFIADDPVMVLHDSSAKKILRSPVFLQLHWPGAKGHRSSAAVLLMQMMDHQPYQFITTASEKEINSFVSFVYRTFNGQDCMFFIRALKNIYTKHGGLETVFTDAYLQHQDIRTAISEFRRTFLRIPHPKRSDKHISDAAKNSACKRINLYLRWMVRSDNHGMDFGLWKQIPASALYCPLDVHTGNTSRELGLLTAKQNNWKAVAELTEIVRKFDAHDPVKYDYALFGLGIYEKV